MGFFATNNERKEKRAKKPLPKYQRFNVLPFYSVKIRSLSEIRGASSNGRALA
jgi:hypothetical protein